MSFIIWSLFGIIPALSWHVCMYTHCLESCCFFGTDASTRRLRAGDTSYLSWRHTPSVEASKRCIDLRHAVHHAEKTDYHLYLTKAWAHHDSTIKAAGDTFRVCGITPGRHVIPGRSLYRFEQTDADNRDHYDRYSRSTCRA